MIPCEKGKERERRSHTDNPHWKCSLYINKSLPLTSPSATNKLPQPNSYFKIHLSHSSTLPHAQWAEKQPDTWGKISWISVDKRVKKESNVYTKSLTPSLPNNIRYSTHVTFFVHTYFPRYVHDVICLIKTSVWKINWLTTNLRLHNWEIWLNLLYFSIRRTPFKTLNLNCSQRSIAT